MLAHPIGTYLLALVFVSEAIALWILWSRLRQRDKSLRDFGWGTPAPISSYIFAIVFAIAYYWLAVQANPTIANWTFQVSILKATAIAAALMAGFFEEIFFRGYIMTALKNGGHGGAIQILVSGGAFGIAHAFWGLPTGHFLQPMLWTFGFGCVSAGIYLYSKRSLGPVIACHILADLLLEPGLLMSAFSRH